MADLTTHVDFETLCVAAESAGCAFSRLTPQGVFLERLGITDRARALAAPLQGDALKNLIAAHRRLTHPEEMGNLFKVLGLYPATATPPPGLQSRLWKFLHRTCCLRSATVFSPAAAVHPPAFLRV